MASTPAKLPLLQGDITLEDALEEEDNMLIRLAYPGKEDSFFEYLLEHRDDIQDIIAHHLNLKQDETCDIAGPSAWLRGSFNVCIPVRTPSRRLMMRCPLPYKLGDAHCPGNVEEKLRCEAATFTWIRENCPEVPIPYLRGVGLPDGQSFTPLEKLPIHRWLFAMFQKLIDSLFQRTPSSSLVPHPPSQSLLSGYLLMDYVEETQGKMLAYTWKRSKLDEKLRTNFFRSLSRIMLSLGRVPLPRIGSFIIDDKGKLSLSNRPLTLRCQYLENENIPQVIPRDRCYSSVDTYLNDLLDYVDERLRHQPNSCNDKYDASAQMAVFTIMRALLSRFSTRDLRYGPFIFQLTDLHPGNMFVDEQCNVTSLVDLEWGASLPIETDSPPLWLSGHFLDEVTDHMEEYNAMREEFMNVFQAEEEKMLHQTTRTSIMRRAWETGMTWCITLLGEPKALYNLFFECINPIYWPSFTDDDERGFQRTLARYWTIGGREFIAAKDAHREAYLKELRQVFEN